MVGSGIYHCLPQEQSTLMVNFGQLKASPDDAWPTLKYFWVLLQGYPICAYKRSHIPLRITVTQQVPVRCDVDYRALPSPTPCHSFLVVTEELEPSLKLGLHSVPKWGKNPFSLLGALHFTMPFLNAFLCFGLQTFNSLLVLSSSMAWAGD